MEQLTKEEVEDLRRCIAPFAGSGDMSDRFECIIRLCDAYLALREEVERWKDRVEVRDKHIDALQADNEALQGTIDALDAELRQMGGLNRG